MQSYAVRMVDFMQVRVARETLPGDKNTPKTIWIRLFGFAFQRKLKT